MMDLEMLTELFRVPFITGLLLTVVITLTGAWLRLREEWLAGLGLPHIAAAGGVLGTLIGLPVTLSAFLATGAAAGVKTLAGKASNNHFALMLILGWGAALMLAANSYQGEMIGEGLLRGQIYFSTLNHLYGVLGLGLLVLCSFSWLNRRLLVQQFFPDHHSANQIASWPHELLFAVILVSAVVLGTLSLGALPAFALFFVPSWVAFGLAAGWKQGLILSLIIGISAYIAAFLLAILLDQPFGPTLTLLLSAVCLLRLIPAR
ncbi:MAG: ABC transporter [Halomonadaceae bacterium]|nr:MAG: ABC transporter [Halomonadaceae bacterium]